MSDEKKRSMVAAGTALLVAIAVLIPLGGFLVFRFVLEKPGLREDPEATTVASSRSGSSDRMRPSRVFATSAAPAPVRWSSPSPAAERPTLEFPSKIACYCGIPRP